jgi:hypothetical protein
MRSGVRPCSRLDVGRWKLNVRFVSLRDERSTLNKPLKSPGATAAPDYGRITMNITKKRAKREFRNDNMLSERHLSLRGRVPVASERVPVASRRVQVASKYVPVASRPASMGSMLARGATMHTLVVPRSPRVPCGSFIRYSWPVIWLFPRSPVAHVGLFVILAFATAQSVGTLRVSRQRPQTDALVRRAVIECRQDVKLLSDPLISGSELRYE